MLNMPDLLFGRKPLLKINFVIQVCIMNKRKNTIINVLLISAFLGYFSFKMYEQQRILNSKNRELLQLQEAIAEERRLNEDLLMQKETLYTHEYVERIAREKLGMVKAGEKIFIDVNE